MNHTALLDRISTDRLQDLGQQLRVDSVRASAAANSGHPTSSMSAADLMAVLLARHLRYDFADPHAAGNDHLIFSKGHASPLLYAMYRAAGAIGDAELLSYRSRGSRLEGHPTPQSALGGCGHRLARPGPAGGRGARAYRALPRPAAVPGLGAVRGRRIGRGLRLGGVRACGLPRAGQPDRDRRREPAWPARADPARLGHRGLRAADRRVRLAHDRDRWARRDRDRAGLHRGRGDGRAADGHPGPDPQGPGGDSGRGPARCARQAAARPRTRPSASWAARAPARWRCSRRRPAAAAARVPGRPAAPAGLRGGVLGGDPRRVRRGAGRGRPGPARCGGAGQ